MKTRNVLILSLMIALSATACEKEGPAERLGESIDEAAEGLKGAGNDVGNAIEDACEDIKEGAGADDKDC